MSEQETLKPQEERNFGHFSYLFMWMGGCIAIGVFAIGSSLIGDLNLFQAVMSMVVGTIIIAIALVLNGRAGNKYGIPYTIHLRSAFGIKGSKIPGLIRAVPALVWFGFQSWVGAGAINAILKTMFGFDSIWICFLLFQGIQVALSLYGFKGIKWLENIGAIFILGALAYMFYSVINRYGLEISSSVVNIEGSWGLAFWGGTTAFIGQYSTMILNVGDYSRQYKRESRSLLTGALYWFAIGPAILFMGLIGLVVTGATGISDPVAVFTNSIENPILMTITLLFIIFAQITTNVLNNLVPPVYVFMDAFKLSYKKSVVLVGILAIFTFPWKLVTEESAAGLAVFIQTYAAFLGPIFAVMMVDYFFIRKQKLDVESLYDENGPFKGVNISAIIAIIIGAIVALIEVRLSWYSSLIPAGLSYYLLMKHMSSSKRFLVGTDMESEPISSQKINM